MRNLLCSIRKTAGASARSGQRLCYSLSRKFGSYKHNSIVISSFCDWHAGNICNSSTMGCPLVRGDNPRAIASGLSYVQVDKHGLAILHHLHQCRPCTGISC